MSDQINKNVTFERYKTFGVSVDKDGLAHQKNGYLRFNNVQKEIVTNGKVVQTIKTDEREISTKPHGIFARTIRFFGGPTKQDMVENREIRTRFWQNFENKYGFVGNRMLEKVGFLERDADTNQYRLRNAGDPMTKGSQDRLNQVAYKLGITRDEEGHLTGAPSGDNKVLQNVGGGNGYIRYKRVEMHDRLKVAGDLREQTISTKEHGPLGRAVRFFGGPTKQDMKDNEAIRDKFVNEFRAAHPRVADQVLWQTKFIEADPDDAGGYKLRHAGEPLTVGAMERLVKLAERLEAKLPPPPPRAPRLDEF